MIGIIAATAEGAAFQRQGHISDEAAHFLVGYREAAASAGFGVRMLPVILVGSWTFPGTVRLGQEKRCLVGLHDGSGNDEIYRSVLQYYPELSHDDEIVISFIAVDSFRHCSVEEGLNTGRLAACFDLAVWAVDALPLQARKGLYDLGKGDVKALSLGIWVNILVTWLCYGGMFSQSILQKMRLVICKMMIERLAFLKTGDLFDVDSYMKGQPGLMVRLLAMLSCCSDEQFYHLSVNPERQCRAILERSFRFFQGERPLSG